MKTADGQLAIQVADVSKTFKLPHERATSLKTVIVNFYRRNRSYELQKTLQKISFDIKEGEFFGIVGRNGSGKSTMLKMLAGIYAPSEGAIQVNGSLTPFIELGVGFNPELTGRENVYLNGALLGFSHGEMASMYDDIVTFAELERFMDQKLKNYSSGMQVRLAFSIAIRADSDILLLDEVLAVGDAIFQKKCYNYFKQLKRDKKTVVFVSHDTNALLEYCDRGVLIDKGRVVSSGTITKVVNDYTDLLHRDEEAATQQPGSEKVARWGTGEVAVASLITKGTDGKKKAVFGDKDDDIIIEATYEAKQLVPAPVYGITVLDAEGQRVFTSNTLWSQVDTADIAAGKTVTVAWRIPNAFNGGDFTVSPAVADNRGDVIYDWVEGMSAFKVRKHISNLSPINIKHDIKVQ